jgi:hypothetical protein
MEEQEMAENNLNSAEASEHTVHPSVRIVIDGLEVTSTHRRRNGRQIRELGVESRVHGFKTEIVTGHVRVIPDHEEVELHEHEHFRTVIEIYLDGELVISRSNRLTGRQIRELGPSDRVDGFETQEIDDRGKKKRTIGDSEVVEIHEHERFRTVPNHGGPGAI